MRDLINVTGIVLKQMPIGEYDRRIVILTSEKGKISAIAKGARRPGNKFTMATEPFTFGIYKLYPGKDTYRLEDVEIKNYFEDFRKDFDGICYGTYFCEIADYYTRENNDDREMMKLLYMSLKALIFQGIPNRLVKCIFELKSIVINGEFPGAPKDRELDESTIYSIEYIAYSPVEKLYSFNVSDKVLFELTEIANEYRVRFMDRDFKSLEILKTL